MVRGIESFRKWFRGHEKQYVLIGGAACDLLMSGEGLDFRATKDIDMVLIIEAVDADFGRRFWEYVVSGGYEHRNKSLKKHMFYRFSNPVSNDFPVMIELFTRKPDLVILPDDAVLSPIPMDEDISSLSAILLDDDYYDFLRHGRTSVMGITVLDAPHLIPFKAKAWLDLSDLKAKGEHVDSRNIKKHKNDVFRLTELLEPDMGVLDHIPDTVRADMGDFIERMMSETVELKQLGINGKSKEDILDGLRNIYI